MKVNVTVDTGDGLQQEEHDGVTAITSDDMGLVIEVGNVVTSYEDDEWVAFAVQKESKN